MEPNSCSSVLRASHILWHSCNCIIDALLPLVRNGIGDDVIFICSKFGTVSFENIVERSAYENVSKSQSGTNKVIDDTNLANLEAEEPALDRMNSSLASIRFQYFSPPLHSMKIARL